MLRASFLASRTPSRSTSSRPASLCNSRWKYLGLGRFFSSEDFIPWGLGVKEGREPPHIQGIQRMPPHPRPVISFLCPRPTIGPHSESAQHRHHRDQRHCPPRAELEGRVLSSGSLWLISLSPATRGRKYHIHKREQGSEAELAPPASKQHPIS